MKESVDNSPTPKQSLPFWPRLALVSVLAAALWQTGCTTTKPAPKANHNTRTSPLPTLATLGTIGVISTSTVPKFSLHEPLNRNEAGELTARRIVFLGGNDFTDNTSATVAYLTLGLSTWVLSAAAVPSRIVAEGLAVSENDRAMAQSAMQKAISDLNLQDELRARVARVTEERACLPMKLVAKPFPPGKEQEFSRMTAVMAGTLAWLPRGQTATDYLAEQGVDTILELQIIQPGLKGSGRINPPLALCVNVRARLLDAHSGQERWQCAAQYRSSKRKFTAWAANDAQLFRRELDLCFETLAEQIANQLAGKPSHRAGVIIAKSAGPLL